MDLYRQMYDMLFNAMTDAAEALKQQNFGQALQIITKAQQDTEEFFIRAEESPSTEPL